MAKSLYQIHLDDELFFQTVPRGLPEDRRDRVHQRACDFRFRHRWVEQDAKFGRVGGHHGVTNNNNNNNNTPDQDPLPTNDVEAEQFLARRRRMALGYRDGLSTEDPTKCCRDRRRRPAILWSRRWVLPSSSPSSQRPRCDPVPDNRFDRDLPAEKRLAGVRRQIKRSVAMRKAAAQLGKRKRQATQDVARMHQP